MAIGACADSTTAPSAPDPQSASLDRKSANNSSLVCDADNGGLELPSGFCAIVVAKDVPLARHMAVHANGDLYVALDNKVDGSIIGGILGLRDTDGDGRADVRVRFGPTGGNGIALRGNQLYFAPDDRVIRYDLANGALLPAGPPVTVVSALPSTGDHHRKTVVLDGAGGMFVNIGSEGNACQVQNRVPFSPGIDPCPELATRAGVWYFNANATGQVQASGSRFATELRNMNALAINPADGALYGIQLGRDQLFDNWPTLFTERDDARLPAEELFRIDRGQSYGWPYCYYDGQRNKKVLAPEYGGDGKIVGRCGTRALPLDEYPAHWSPLSMLFYTGTQFPKQYEGGLFVAFHGSRFDPSLQPAGPGYVVTFVPWHKGKPRGQYKTFADGFDGGTPTPMGAAHRPVGLAQAPDGSLYISDDKGGWIWRVIYVGSGKR
ncbi:MAG: PQQ-dependent sugar dehydrogenase [Gemmatimonadales bacterium]|nr:PQQ-dependent sugar dehydrogenase [Gemmatimonadales bacterium]